MIGRLNWYGDRLLAEIRNATPDALFAAAEELQNAAKAKAPRRSGDLINSGYVSSQKRSTYKNAKIHRKEQKPRNPEDVVIGFAAFYARYYELGTKRQAARPFLRPALDELKGKLGATIVEKVKARLK